jgi:hypothetical protein
MLLFAWKGGELDLRWPPSHVQDVAPPKPPAEALAWAADLRPILPRMLLADREYLAAFYDALAFILLQDGDRSTPIIGDTEKFAVLHAGSLQLAIKKANVGKYPGLDKAIDVAFFNAAGAEVASLDAKKRGQLVMACSVLSWAFKVHGNE